MSNFCEPTWLPDPIERACRVIPEICIKPLVQPCFRLLVRRVSYRAPAQRFRVSVQWLAEQLGKSEKTIDRYLAWLKAEGWITREQTRIQNPDGSYPQAWTGLTDKALQALGLVVCGTDPGDSPKPCPSDKAKPPAGANEASRLIQEPQEHPWDSPVQGGRNKFWRRAGRAMARVPASLAALARMIGAGRVCWLMGLCKARGCRLQDFGDLFLTLDPVSYVLSHFRRLDRQSQATEVVSQRPNAGAYEVVKVPEPGPAEQPRRASAARELRERWGLAPVGAR